MKESDRKFEKLLKEAVCSYHKEEMDALPSEEELQDIQLSDDFYRKMDGLVKKQKRRWQYRFVRYGSRVIADWNDDGNRRVSVKRSIVSL